MEKKEISIDLLNQILHYLSFRPYREVVELITKIKQEAESAPVEEK
jgi:hypothetical protein